MLAWSKKFIEVTTNELMLCDDAGNQVDLTQVGKRNQAHLTHGIDSIRNAESHSRYQRHLRLHCKS